MAKLILILASILLLSTGVIAQGTLEGFARGLCVPSTMFPNINIICKPLTLYIDFEKRHAYIDDYLKRLKQDKNAVPAPVAQQTGNIIQLIGDIQSAVSLMHIELDLSDLTEPNPQSLISNDMTERRNAVMQLPAYIIGYGKKMSEYRLILSGIKRLEVEILNDRLAFDALTKAYLEFASIDGRDLMGISNYIGIAGLDIMTQIRPKLVKLERTIKEKRNDVEDLLIKENKKLGKIIANAKLVVSAERSFLMSKMKTVTDEHTKLNVQFVEFKDSVTKASAEIIDKLSVEKNTLKGELREMGKILDGLANEASSIAQNYKQNKKAYDSFTYKTCPKGNDLANCNHEDLKSIYISQRESMKGELDFLKGSLRQKEAEVDNYKINYNAKSKAVSKRTSQLNAETLSQGKLANQEIAGFSKRVNESQKRIEELDAILLKNESSSHTLNFLESSYLKK